MANDPNPAQIIADIASGLSARSDEAILAALAVIPALADEDDPCWNTDAYWHAIAYPYLALWDIAAERRLRPAIPLILDRACFGDPGEIMRNLCHTLEAIVKPHWFELTEPCVQALQSPRAGTRLWAAHQLGRLRDPAAFPALEQAAQDVIPWVREKVASAITLTREKMTN